MSEELKTADALLDQADALLHRHRGAASLMTASGGDLAADDLPVLTEVVDERSAQSEPVAATQPDRAREAGLADRLAALDGLVAREVDAWLANELPQLLSAELDGLTERLRGLLLDRMRATLLPALARHVANAVNGDSEP